MAQAPFSLAFVDTQPALTLLLIHGFPLNSTQWWPQINGLDHVARVIAPDLRGFGQTPAVKGDSSIGQYAEDCYNLLYQLNIQEPVVVCGLSMGGYIALEFFRRYPEKVRGLILTATRAAADSGEARQSRNKAIDQVNSDGAAAVTEGMIAKLLSPYQYNRNDALIASLERMLAAASPEGIVGALAAMRDRRDSRSLLRRIDVPTLIIHGQDDDIVPLVEAQLMDDAIPDCELHVLERAGHLPNLEQPVLWNRAAELFLNRLALR